MPALLFILLAFAFSPSAMAQVPVQTPAAEAGKTEDSWFIFWKIPTDVFNLLIACFGGLQFYIYVRQAKIMRQQKEIAQNQADFNRLLPTLTQRALIAYEEVSSTLDASNGRWSIEITWRNYGQTPANSIQIAEIFKAVPPDKLATYVPVFERPEFGMQVTMAPGKSFVAGQFRIPRTLLASENHAICGCRVFYRDVFQPAQEHQTTFCFEVVRKLLAQEEYLEFRFLPSAASDS